MIGWLEFNEYVTECRERAITEASDAVDMKALGKAQGKIELCSELLNLKAIFNTLKQARDERERSPVQNPRAVALQAERVRLSAQGKVTT